jgi:hypothetical protein
MRGCQRVGRVASHGSDCMRDPDRVPGHQRAECLRRLSVCRYCSGLSCFGIFLFRHYGFLWSWWLHGDPRLCHLHFSSFVVCFLVFVLALPQSWWRLLELNGWSDPVRIRPNWSGDASFHPLELTPIEQISSRRSDRFD